MMGLLKRIVFCTGLFALLSCSDDSVQESTTEIAEQPAALTDLLTQYNEDIAAVQTLLEGDAEIVDYTVDESGTYRLQLSDGTISTATSRTGDDADIPLFGVDEDGYWIVLLGGETIALTNLSGDPVPALRKTGKGVYTPQISVGSDGYWLVSFNGIQWKQLSTSLAADMTGKSVVNFSLYRTVEMDESGQQLTLVLRNGGTELTVKASASVSTDAWKKFVMKSDDNVLLDFSYAGYDHGETAPPDGFAWGYTVINVQEYMNENSLSARDAFIRILDEYGLTQSSGNSDAKIVIYFPEGEYVLHNDDDNTYDSDKSLSLDDGYGYPDSKGNNTSNMISIYGGNFVIKGDGPEKTRLVMETPMLPESEELYSSPVMISIRNNGFLGSSYDVTGSAQKGAFSVEIADASSFSVGEWVCLYMHDNSQELIAQELEPYEVESTFVNIIQEGVQVEDIHQIVRISGNTVTFKEPIMHEVDPQWDWQLYKYRHYENVGVEDLSFVGNGCADFQHHRSWNDDGAYKPVNFLRLVNSWMRRVKFTSVSEAASIISCANFSAYDIDIDGTGGHSAIRSQGSSRVFIGDVRDYSDRPLADEWSASYIEEGAGQYHACGVSKPSMGAVIWRVSWGSDACFEAHATQPRATLIDNCTGGFMQTRQGGDAGQMPNHLSDLTIWNMNSINSPAPKGNGDVGTEFDWWRTGWRYWKFLPPVIVGFHGDPISFVQDQVTLDEGNGTMVEPQSLYEAQLEHRLGYVPAWLSALK